MTGPEPQTITKKELVNRIAESTSHTKVVVKDIIQRFLDEIVGELTAGNRLEFREFGVFEVRWRAARRAQNQRTLEKVEVPAKRVVKFKVGRLMREKVGVDEDEDDEEEEITRAGPTRRQGAVTPAAAPASPSPPKSPPSSSPF